MANKQFWQICYKCSCYLQCKTYTIPGEHCYKIIDALKLVVGVKNSESRLKIIKKELKPIGIRYKYFHSNNYGGDCVTSIKFNYDPPSGKAHSFRGGMRASIWLTTVYRVLH